MVLDVTSTVFVAEIDPADPERKLVKCAGCHIGLSPARPVCSARHVDGRTTASFERRRHGTTARGKQLDRHAASPRSAGAADLGGISPDVAGYGRQGPRAAR